MIPLEFVRELQVLRSDTDETVLHVAAASGLILRDRLAIVVGDDLLSLGIFPLESGKPGFLRRLFAGELPTEKRARKKAKPDLECLLEIDRAGGSPIFVAVPSGSKAHRKRGAVIDGENVRELDFGPLFARLEDEVVELNLEGAVEFEDEILLFHRGNSKGSENAIIHFDRDEFLRGIGAGSLGPAGLRKTTPVPLGEIDGIRLTFGDAAKDADGRIWFLASAEATDDAYLDGAYGGAIIGRLARDLMRVEECLRIASPTKPEGLAFDPNDPRAFYIVTDADDHEAVSGLFRGRLD